MASYAIECIGWVVGARLRASRASASGTLGAMQKIGLSYSLGTDGGGPLIRKYEGTLDRFTGDGMLVFFNDPLPCEDAPDRAARLAIEMRDAVASLVPRWQRRDHRLGLGIDMAQGYATLGRIGFEDRFDYTAIGAVINLAARLCAEASDGEVLVSGRLAAAIEGISEVEDLGERQLRGMARPASVARLHGVRAPPVPEA